MCDNDPDSEEEVETWNWDEWRTGARRMHDEMMQREHGQLRVCM